MTDLSQTDDVLILILAAVYDRYSSPVSVPGRSRELIDRWQSLQ